LKNTLHTPDKVNEEYYSPKSPTLTQPEEEETPPKEVVKEEIFEAVSPPPLEDSSPFSKEREAELRQRLLCSLREAELRQKLLSQSKQIEYQELVK